MFRLEKIMRKTMRVINGLTALFIFAVWAPLAATQVNDKTFEQWTLKEAETLLTESPWAQTLGGSVAVGGLELNSAVGGSSVTVRLRSAVPIRQALARVRQIKSKYEKLSASEKAAIDAKNKPLLECLPCADYYVVTIGPAPGTSKGVPTILQTMPLAQLKLNILLKNEKEETRELINFVKPKFAGDEAIFFFERFNASGQPLITPANRKVTLWFDPRFFEGNAMRLVSVNFDVAKITVEGKVDF